jgi:hypothetical protein
MWKLTKGYGGGGKKKRGKRGKKIKKGTTKPNKTLAPTYELPQNLCAYSPRAPYTKLQRQTQFLLLKRETVKSKLNKPRAKEPLAFFLSHTEPRKE